MKMASSRVDDQVCDCCDGSDEGYVAKCPNTCREVAQKERLLIDKLHNDFKIGSTIRSDLMQRLRDDKSSLVSSATPLGMELHNVEEELDDLRRKLADLLLKKDEVEEQIRSSQRTIVLNSLRLEALPVDALLLSLSHLLKALHIDSRSLTKYTASKADRAGISATKIIDEDNITGRSPDDDEYSDDEIIVEDDVALGADDNIGANDATPASLVENEDTASCRIVELTNDFDLLPLCDSSIDSALSAAFFIVDLLLEHNVFDEILLILGYYRSAESFVGIEGFLQDPENNFTGEDKTCGVLKYPAAAEELSEEYCSLRELIPSRIRAHVTEEQSLTILSSEITSIRGSVESLEQRVTELQRKQNLAKDAADDMSRFKDFLEYLALKDTCFEVVDGAFKYSLCILSKVTQSEVGGSRNEVTLGTFKRIEERYQDGISTEMFFENGQYCHAFGERKAQVSVLCAARNALISAAEPSTCAYQLVFESPIGCSPKYAQMIGLAT
jgi:predicted  nucleic acid-binding Zn-ribbon protein